MRTAYELLGVSEKATDAEILRAYRKLILQFHPDRNNASYAAEKTRELNRAKDLLLDPEKRKRYDEDLWKKRMGAGSATHAQATSATSPNEDVEASSEEASNPDAFQFPPEPASQAAQDNTGADFDVTETRKPYSQKARKSASRKKKVRRKRTLYRVLPHVFSILLLSSIIYYRFVWLEAQRQEETQSSVAILSPQTTQPQGDSQTSTQDEASDVVASSMLVESPPLVPDSSNTNPSTPAEDKSSPSDSSETQQSNLVVRDLIAPFSNSVKTANSTGNIREARILVPENATKIEIGVINQVGEPEEKLGIRHAGKYGYITVDGTRIISCARGFAACKACKSIPQENGHDITHLVSPGKEVAITHRHRQISPALGIRMRFHLGEKRLGVTEPSTPEQPANNDEIATEQRAKTPVPNVEILAELNKQIDELYGVTATKIDGSDQSVVTARSMLQDSQSLAGVDPKKYALLKRSIELSSLSGEFELMRSAIRELVGVFEVDDLEIKVEAYEAIASAVPDADCWKLSTAVSIIVEEALARDDFAIADSAIITGKKVAGRLRDGDLLRFFKGLGDRCTLLRKAYVGWKLAEVVSDDDNPTDERAANLGKYLCFLKDDWDAGLIELSNSNDPALQRIAKAELEKAMLPNELADEWSAYAANAPRELRPAIIGRARHWFVRSLKEQTGLDRRITLAKLRELEEEQLSSDRAADTYVNSIGMKFRKVQPGSFVMGSDEGHPDEAPAHEVILTSSFQIGIYEVTQSQYSQVLGSNPSKEKNDLHAVASVTWNDAKSFCEQLSGLALEQELGNRYRLPTEAEWEYACRAGTTTKYYFGDDPSELVYHAWYAANSNNKAHPVGLGKPNRFGLYDVLGGVYEWTLDSRMPYQAETIVDPRGGSPGLARGGGWHSQISEVNVTRRWHLGNATSYDIGFRVVLENAISY